MLILLSVIFLYFCLKYYFKPTWCQSQICLLGKIVIVTGANTGIGFETALDFAKRGAKVILACRNKTKANLAKNLIIELTGNSTIIVKIVNLASFDSVKNFANEINTEEEQIDILVHNAGVLSLGISEDGLPLMLQVNYLSRLLVTLMLHQALSNGRVINLCSKLGKLSRFGTFHTSTTIFNDFFCSQAYNFLFTCKLAQMGIVAVSVDPGGVQTELLRNLRGRTKIVIDFFRDNFFQTSREGAQSVIHASLAQNIQSGKHFENCQVVPVIFDKKLDSFWKQSLFFCQINE